MWSGRISPKFINSKTIYKYTFGDGEVIYFNLVNGKYINHHGDLAIKLICASFLETKPPLYCNEENLTSDCEIVPEVPKAFKILYGGNNNENT